MAKPNQLQTDCVTPTGRLSYPSLFEVKEQMTPGTFKFECTILFDKKTANLAEIQQMLKNAAINKFGPDSKKWPKFQHPAIKDGDLKADQTAYHGCWYITPKANEDRRPQVFGPNKAALVKEDGVIYAGCLVKAYVTAFAYGGPGSKMAPGVTFGLNAIQKVGDGDRFDGRKDASAVFDAIEDGSEDPANFSNSTSDENSFL